jgi:uncharacterized membrane protein
MSDLTTALVIAAALGSALIAGVFFAFSTFVMAALRRLPAEQGMAAMQHINITVINPWFIGVFMGTAAACVAAAVAVVADWNGASGPLVLIAAALYLVGSIGLTSGYHQPRNLALARLDPDGAEVSRQWTAYLEAWVPANHVRTIACLIAAGLLIAALQAS